MVSSAMRVMALTGVLKMVFMMLVMESKRCSGDCCRTPRDLRVASRSASSKIGMMSPFSSTCCTSRHMFLVCRVSGLVAASGVNLTCRVLLVVLPRFLSGRDTVVLLYLGLRSPSCTGKHNLINQIISFLTVCVSAIDENAP